MHVQEAWAVIHNWLGRRYPTMLRLLNGPASPAAFSQLERQLQQRLPEDFKASYTVHDGSNANSGILIGLPLLSLLEIGRVWEMWAEIAEGEETVADLSEECQSRPAGAVKLLYANRGWVPFAGDSQNHVAIDFDPGPKGEIGQIINCGRDDMIRHVIADTFEGFLAFVAQQFAADRVGMSSDESSGEPRWLALVGGQRDFLTGLQELLGTDHSKRNP